MFPVCYNDEEFHLFDGSQLQEQISLNIDKIKGPYQDLVNSVPGFAQIFSMTEWRDINCMVQSRSFGIHHDNSLNNERSLVMVPFCDMMNHSKDYNVEWTYSNEQRGFLMRATQHIKRG